MQFKELDYKAMKFNPFNMLYDEWALVSAGTDEKHNTMTVSWGALGIMWNKPVAIIYLRPQRYTKEFIDKYESFTISFFPSQYKKALGLLGSKSGRDGDKIAESGLTPYSVGGTVAFEQAHTILLCKKIFGGQQLEASKFVDTTLDSAMYPQKDYHYMYFGEIEKVFIEEKVFD